MTKPLTKEEIEKAKLTQKQIIAGCDAAIADCQRNIRVLNDEIVQQTATKTLAQETYADLEDDYPVAEGAATVNGNVEGTTLVDSSLVGSTTLFIGKILTIFPDGPKQDSSGIASFNSTTGELKVAKKFKDGQVKQNTAYKVLSPIPEL